MHQSSSERLELADPDLSSSSQKCFETTDKQDIPFPKNVVFKQKPAFLMIKDGYSQIKNQKMPILSEIPLGNKSNCMMLLDTSNIDRTNDGKMIFFDDCGTYSKTQHHSFTLLSPNLNQIYASNDKWYHNKNFTKELKDVDPSNLIKVTVLTSKLDVEGKFKRRITRSSGLNRALVEYIGQYDFSTIRKMRTNPSAIRKVNDLVGKKPTEIQNICAQDIKINPINLKSIYNKKSRDTASNVEAIKSSQKDIIDDPFIQYKIISKNFDDIYILFNDNQVEDLRFHIQNYQVFYCIFITVCRSMIFFVPSVILASTHFFTEYHN